MSNTIYTSTGCVRCKITKRFMTEHDIDYDEHDIKIAGKDAFAQFYRSNRKEIFRDQDGIEFPVFSDGNLIRQGVSVIIGHLVAGDGLSGFIKRSELHGEWIDGFCISDGDPSRTDELIQVLTYLKKNGLKIQLTTSGYNAALLEKIIVQGLGDRLIMEVKGPVELYEQLAGQPIEKTELEESIRLAAKFPDYQFFTAIAPVQRDDGRMDYLTPEEIGQTAQMIEAATGSKKHPYELRPFKPQSTLNDSLKAMDELPSNAMFKYRTAARPHLVMTEIEK